MKPTESSDRLIDLVPEIATYRRSVGSRLRRCIGTSIKRALRCSVGLAAVLAVSLGFAPSARAQHAGDVLLATTPTGKLTTLGVRVYGETFSALSPVKYIVDDPGFDRATVYPVGYGTLPASTALKFVLEPFGPPGAPRSTLWFWDGAGPNAHFSPLTNGTQFSVSRFANAATVDGGNDPVPGFALGTTSLTGGIHVHPDFRVTGPAGSDPAIGIYAISMRLAMTGRQTSEPVYFLFSTPEVVASAMPLANAWASSIAAVPEPESYALMLAGALVLAWRVRCSRRWQAESTTFTEARSGDE